MRDAGIQMAAKVRPEPEAGVALRENSPVVPEPGARLDFATPEIRSAAIEAALSTAAVAEWSNVSEGISCSGRLPAALVSGEEVEAYNHADLQGRRDQRRTGTDLRPVRRSHVHEYPIDDESLLFDPKAQSLYYLNHTAYAIWRQCDGRTVHDLASALTRTHNVDLETSLGHVFELVSLFNLGGLLEKEAMDAG